MRSAYKLLAAVCLLLGPQLTAAGQQSPVPAAPKVLARSTVFKYERSDPYDLQNLYGFNHAPSIVRLPDGRLLAAWFSGPFEASVHQVVLSATSADEGKTWSAAAVLQDFPRKSDFDPAFIVDRGRVWLFFSAGRWNRYPFVGSRQREQQEVGLSSFQIWARYSDDSGKIWCEPQTIYDQTGHGCRSNGIRLSSGELVLPVHSFNAPHVAGVLRSVDAGTTWKRCGQIATPERVGAAEPTIVELSHGHVLMALRTTDGSLWLSRSKDRGETWEAPIKTELVAAAASHNLLRLSDGRLVLTHGASAPPLRSKLTVRVSADEGLNWGAPLLLDQIDPPPPDDKVWSRQVTYPSAVELQDGSLAVVWARIELSIDSQTGTIESARIRVD